MLRTRTRRLAALAAGVVLLGALAGCGGDDDKGDAKKASDGTSSSSSTSPEAPAPSSSAEPIDGDEVDTEDFIARITSAMRDKKTSHMVLDVGSSMRADADMRYGDNGSTAMKMTMDSGGTKVQVILVDGTMYMQNGAGQKYLRISKDAPQMGSLLDQFEDIGPQASVEALETGMKKVVKGEKTTLDGVEVTHYQVTVDAQSIAKTLGAGSMAGLPDTVTYDMYVDSDDLLRKVKMNVSGQTVTMTVTQWGEPVDIKAPPANKVISR